MDDRIVGVLVITTAIAQCDAKLVLEEFRLEDDDEEGNSRNMSSVKCLRQQ